jgi:glycine cleavage system protein P-like pyridoxal-binding family
MVNPLLLGVFMPTGEYKTEIAAVMLTAPNILRVFEKIYQKYQKYFMKTAAFIL